MGEGVRLRLPIGPDGAGFPAIRERIDRRARHGDLPASPFPAREEA